MARRRSQAQRRSSPSIGSSANEDSAVAKLLTEVAELREKHKELEARIVFLEGEKTQKTEKLQKTPKRRSPQPGPSGIGSSSRRNHQKRIRSISSDDESPGLRPRKVGKPPVSTEEDDDVVFEVDSTPETEKKKTNVKKAAPKKKGEVNYKDSGSDYDDETDASDASDASDDDSEFKAKPGRAAPPNGRRSGARPPRRSTRNQVAVYIHPKNSRQLEKLVNSVDGTVVDDLSFATHFVADKLEESVEFACAAAKHIPMLQSKWLSEGNAQQNKQTYSKYLLRDERLEEKLGLNMDILMEVNVFPFVEFTFAAETKKKEVQKMVECCQARYVEVASLPAGGFLITEKPQAVKDNKKIRCITYEKFFRAVCKQSLKSLKA